MPTPDELDVAGFAAAYRRLALAVDRAAPHHDPFAPLLEDHLGEDPTDLPVVSIAVDVFDQPNLQRALDALGSAPEVEILRTVGIRGQHRMFGGISLATLTQSRLSLEIGPVDYVELPVDTDETLTCIALGLLLISIGSTAFALLVRSADDHRNSGVTVEVMGPDRESAAALLARIRALMAEHNVFRRKIVSLTPGGQFGNSLVAHFIERPHIGRTDVVLPAGVLERVERLTVDFSARAASLRAGGRHLRRGLLLHGPPGTGKSHTVRYLLSSFSDRTAFVLSGQGLAAIRHTVGLARALQPSIVVLEDVDLVAEERTRPHAGTNPVLFELLNQMDGVEEDADIVFLLTTNRPDLLEPALASRPGRVDLAIEIPLPAAPERQRLLDLYSVGLRVDVADWAAVVERTEGSTAAFLRELLRQAALEGAGEDSEAPTLTETGLLASLADMAQSTQSMTARLLGAPS